MPLSGDHEGRTAANLAAVAEAAGLRATPAAGIEAALRDWGDRSGGRPPRVLITGSLYLAGEVLALNGTPPD